MFGGCGGGGIACWRSAFSSSCGGFRLFASVPVVPSFSFVCCWMKEKVVWTGFWFVDRCFHLFLVLGIKLRFPLYSTTRIVGARVRFFGLAFLWQLALVLNSPYPV